MRKAARDAEAARHMAAAVDRDFSGVNQKLDALRVALNGLGQQTAGSSGWTDAWTGSSCGPASAARPRACSSPAR